MLEHFKVQYIASAEDHSADEIYDRMVEHKYGPGLRDPMQPIDWDRVFAGKLCPECQGGMAAVGESWACPKCGLAIPTARREKRWMSTKRR